MCWLNILICVHGFQLFTQAYGKYKDKNGLEYQVLSSWSHDIKVLERIRNENMSNVVSISLYRKEFHSIGNTAWINLKRKFLKPITLRRIILTVALFHYCVSIQFDNWTFFIQFVQEKIVADRAIWYYFLEEEVQYCRLGTFSSMHNGFE